MPPCRAGHSWRGGNGNRPLRGRTGWRAYYPGALPPATSQIPCGDQMLSTPQCCSSAPCSAPPRTRHALLFSSRALGIYPRSARIRPLKIEGESSSSSACRKLTRCPRNHQFPKLDDTNPPRLDRMCNPEWTGDASWGCAMNLNLAPRWIYVFSLGRPRNVRAAERPG